jgi:hypothetical protein
MSRTEELLAELEAEHDEFLAALEAVDLELVTAPGVVEDWSVRDLVVHVAFWAEHATEALALAATGRGDEFAYDTAETDSMNARLLEESRQIKPGDAVDREERAFEALASAVAALDPSLLELRLGNGDTVAKVIGYDGPEHFREHTAHLRAWFSEDVDEDDGA